MSSSTFNLGSPTSWGKVNRFHDSHEDLLEKGYWQGINSEARNPNLRRAFHKFVDIVRPSILTQGPAANKPLFPTSYLDGLRGFAALLVYIQHHELWVREADGDGEIFENGFGYNGKHHFATFPFIRLFFSGGHFAVPIFFVISGYVLSAKPLQLSEAEEYSKFSDNVSSALFRRWLRLWMPVMATTFIYMTLAHYPGFYTDDYVHKATYGEEVWEWCVQTKNFSFMFDMSGNPFFPFNGHIWTIPVEFKGSIVIYLSVIALARCARNARLCCELVLIYYFLYISDGAFYAMFMGGQLLAHLDLLALNKNLPLILARLEPYREIIAYHLLIIGLYLGGVPAHNQDLNVVRNTRGWYYLSFLKPQAVFDYKWFYMFWAAIFTVAAVPHVGWLKRFFEGRFCQYLGRISFGLYLCHGPVLFILGDRLYSAAGWTRIKHLMAMPQWVNAWPLSHAGPLGLEWGLLVPNLILLPVTLWFAEICTRFIDTPSVKFGQNLYKRLQRGT
ncbi:uncharacterized protein L3040_001684 [Drepanopeziza brunnea f. sp. 'multigermtubi']|uniref:Acyltransferase n=1 Tax=Marssonina brunnea f. sp. multigermtubi (strain MB_m1) TaxID=1072389 RepID=K1WSE7_MARBU|nr:acyltransferase [Drepanopeziza brunnea f. sp. 'multigermtubi' MB_m1]EKD15317.1 acyltransferase [Drepanopeziza brunnea f. sp. 'multigermtubi' MB_m1]KAJ5051921.1 hypothetical protein L3040_001684 [Drepanopeziza brunnea f. sp. 'multigermtubi']